jgi:hypothetical protein
MKYVRLLRRAALIGFTVYRLLCATPAGTRDVKHSVPVARGAHTMVLVR